MRIVNNYRFQGLLTNKVYWRVFGPWDDAHVFGLKDGEGLLGYQQSTDYSKSEFFQIEFKKANVLGEILVGAGPIYSRSCGDIVLGENGHSISQTVPSWNLPKGHFTEWMSDEKIQSKTLFDIAEIGAS